MCNFIQIFTLVYNFIGICFYLNIGFMWEDIGEVEILGNPVDGNTADSAAPNPVLKNRNPDQILPRLSLHKT